MRRVSEGGFFRLARSNSDFARLWGGVTISDLGSSVTNLALPLVAVITLQVGAKEMGFLNASGHLPVLLFALLAGVWIDRAKRKPIHTGRECVRTRIGHRSGPRSSFGWLAIHRVAIYCGFYKWYTRDDLRPCLDIVFAFHRETGRSGRGQCPTSAKHFNNECRRPRSSWIPCRYSRCAVGNTCGFSFVLLIWSIPIEDPI